MPVLQIEGITADANQRHVIERDDGDITLVLRFHPQIEQWTMDAERANKSIFGVKLTTGVKHIEARNMGIEFVVVAEADFDPFQLDDFESGRCNLLMVFDV